MIDHVAFRKFQKQLFLLSAARIVNFLIKADRELGFACDYMCTSEGKGEN